MNRKNKKIKLKQFNNKKREIQKKEINNYFV